jgi:hypothetical protein
MAMMVIMLMMIEVLMTWLTRYMHEFIPMHLSVYEFNVRLKGRKSARYHKGRENILQGWLCFSASRLRQQS